MSRFSLHLVSAAIYLLAHNHLAASPAALENARSSVKEWVEVEQAISREEAAWEQKQALLRDLIAVSEERLAQLDAILGESEGSLSAAEAKRAELLEKEDAIAHQIERIRPALAQLETDLRQLWPHLPLPLREELEAPFQRLPRDSETTTLSLGERARTAIGLIEKIRQFDAGVTVHEAVQSLPGFESPAVVRTLYLGLGQAYYLAPDDAGFGQMTPDGWQWQSAPEIESAVREAMAVADGTSNDLRFISLPVRIRTEEEQ